MTTSGPNLSFWAQNQAFGPDVFILKCSSWISCSIMSIAGSFCVPNFGEVNLATGGGLSLAFGFCLWEGFRAMCGLLTGGANLAV